MSEVRFEKLNITGRRIGKPSWFPAIRELIKSEISAKLDEDDGLFIGFGMFSDTLPYTLQDDYDTPLEQLSFTAAVLENRYLKAVFLPELGGRLWSLYDKENQRDLLLTNTQLLPCNLGIRNAWFAGGVEFNCGRRGHDERTMSPRFAAVVDGGEFPVLRIYEYQRDRETPFQYDCFLPDDSRFLYIRGRIWNPNPVMVPMYWWSNIAVPEVKGSRVVVPADTVFANWYSGGSHALAKLTMPDGEGFDASYPEKFEYVKDHFYNIPENKRRYETLFYPDGYGFCHISTRRLRGRKLFVWGQSQGGRRWNRKLLGPGLDAYIELQGGLARSQQECLPMPPQTAWEWLEGYGALTMAKEKVFGKWQDAVDAVTVELDRIIPEAELDEILLNTRQSVALKPGKVVIQGSGWGALEELRLGGKLAEHLDFGELQSEQMPWAELLENNRMSVDSPESYMVSDNFFQLLKNAAPSWQTAYFKSLNYYRRGDFERADAEISAVTGKYSRKHILHLQANIRRKQGSFAEAAELIMQAGLLCTSDASFIKEVLKMLLEFKEYGKMKELFNAITPQLQALPLIKFMYAAALAHTGNLTGAEDILLENGGLDIPDIREGENSTSELYIFIQMEKAKLAGQTITPAQVAVPFVLDLRMSGV